MSKSNGISLNGSPNIEPDSHIFCSEKATWYDKAINAKTFDKFPK